MNTLGKTGSGKMRAFISYNNVHNGIPHKVIHYHDIQHNDI